MSKFVSCTSKSQERKFDFQINNKIPVKLISSLSDQQQSLICVRFFHQLSNFLLLQQKYVILTSLCILQKWFQVVCIHVECIINRRDRKTT